MTVRISKNEILEADRLLIIDGESQRVCRPLDEAYQLDGGDPSLPPIVMLAGDLVGCALRDGDGFSQQEIDEMKLFLNGLEEFKHYTGQEKSVEYCCECNDWFDSKNMHDIEVLPSSTVENEMKRHGHSSGFICKECYNAIDGDDELSDNDKFGVDPNGKDLT